MNSPVFEIQSWNFAGRRVVNNSWTQPGFANKRFITHNTSVGTQPALWHNVFDLLLCQITQDLQQTAIIFVAKWHILSCISSWPSFLVSVYWMFVLAVCLECVVVYICLLYSSVFLVRDRRESIIVSGQRLMSSDVRMFVDVSDL